MKKIAIIGGGTVSHVRNHLALAAPAYGRTARNIYDHLQNYFIKNSKLGQQYSERTYLTKMANSGEGDLETNEDVSKLVDRLIADEDVKIIFFNPALVDFEGSIAPVNEWNVDWDTDSASGKYETRLKTSEGKHLMVLSPADKIVAKIRKERKDIFLVAFKTTCGASEDEQFLTGLHLLKSASCNLVLANDTKTRTNMIITPEQARYSVTKNRADALATLVEMAVERAQGTFTRSTVVEGEPVAWSSDLVPASLRTVVDHCIAKGAYKPFKGATVGHFATKVDAETFLTSRRKTNFNKMSEVGLVKVESDGPNTVIAHGSRPSVGGQSQRIIFKEHPEADCIVHFHCPPKSEAKLSVRSQAFVECGSHQCGQNTSDGLVPTGIPGVKCVYLDKHGPNIVFNREVDPQLVIDFIDQNFDLSKATDEVDRSQVSVS